uniref:Uncharacterized protein n=1 Tax=Leptobrachium leishanense TaxID=445787 RepID=A0A8C5WBF3_9ANUR
MDVPPGHEEAPVLCIYCVHGPVPAAKTCMQCESSLCDTHLQIHNKTLHHVLVDPTGSIKGRRCLLHNKLLEFYCSEDAVYLCTSCRRDGEHRGHEVDTLIVASAKKKEKLRLVLEKLTSRREEIKKKLESLQEQVTEVEEADAAMDRVMAVFLDIRKQLEMLEKRVQREITRQKDQTVLRVSNLIQRLEIKHKELTSNISRFEKLQSLTDPIAVLEGQDPDRADNRETRPRKSSGSKSSTSSKETQGYLDEGQIMATLHLVLHNLVMQMRSAVYMLDLSLDVNTAGDYVVISGNKKSAQWSHINQARPENPDKFNFFQILSSNVLSSGRYYWEVETSKSGNWVVGVAYSSIDRKGNKSFIGFNSQSWCLRFHGKEYSMVHDSKLKPLTLESPLQTLGIYLDYEAGCLSFYHLTDPIQHLHTFTSTFTEPLHAAFLVEHDGWVTIRS